MKGKLNLRACHISPSRTYSFLGLFGSADKSKQLAHPNSRGVQGERLLKPCATLRDECNPTNEHLEEHELGVKISRGCLSLLGDPLDLNGAHFQLVGNGSVLGSLIPGIVVVIESIEQFPIERKESERSPMGSSGGAVTGNASHWQL